MDFIADLQIHSKYARATSKDITLENLEKFARIKGVNIMGTGDFTHPLWLKELKEKLKEDGSGILRTKSGYQFMLTAEVSNIYSQDKKLRKVHNMIFAPDFATVDQINELLGKKGKLASDGRPILGSYSCIELVDDLMRISKDIEVIPAHALTPWFGVFGSKSGFDSIEECFLDKAKHIHAIETGMSADPAMIWRVENWSKYTLVSNSDAHSYWPWRIGREATVFDLKEPSYSKIIHAIRTREGLKETIEVDPAYGKYHWDGHRVCGVVMSPAEAERNKNVCPRCGRELTIGVEHRILEMADKPEGYRPLDARPFKSLIPLSEVICIVLGVGQPYSKAVWDKYYRLVNAAGSEFAVMLSMPMEKMGMVDEKIAKAIIDVREGRVKIEPGYDGEYGKPLFEGAPKPKTAEKYFPRIKKQKSLMDY